MTRSELTVIMEIVSKELRTLAGGTSGMSRDAFRREINTPWANIKNQIEENLTVEGG